MLVKTISQLEKTVDELKTLLSYLVSESGVSPPLDKNGWYEIHTSIHPYEYAKIQRLLAK